MSIFTDPGPPSSRPWRAQHRAAYGLPPRILLAEDDEEMRIMIACALRTDGCEVTEVPDGGRLLVRVTDLYIEGEPRMVYDLLVSDIRMPVCSGLEILENLRKARWPTPVILMTAFGDDDTRRRANDLGAVLFDKPFEVDDLRTAVMNLVAVPPKPWPPRKDGNGTNS